MGGGTSPLTSTTILNIRISAPCACLTKEEYAKGHIPGAVNIYVGELEKRLAEVPSGHPVVSVCSTGNRSGLGASILARGGLKKVYNLIGGMTAWKEKGYPANKC